LISKSHRLHGQQAIDPARVTQIQEALIREHYLSTDANGKWDATTEAAMQKFQADQGWQTKLMPDSRALMKLGLGPDYSTAINAKDSSFAAPLAPGTTPAAQQSAFAAAAGVSR
jgi:peptidoglycan hydrolase-like protein with peptidoglycan-binding domain